MFNLIKEDNIFKFLSITSFSLTILALTIIFQTPSSQGYEPSTYSMYPATLWVLFFSSFFISISLIFSSLFIKLKKVILYSSFLNIALLNLILFFLPLIRNYFTNDLGDTSQHYSMILDIIKTGSIGAHDSSLIDAYPITHIFSASIQIISNLSLTDVVQFVPIVFYLVFITFIYLFSQELFGDKKKSIVLVVLLFIPILKVYMYYQSQLFFFFMSIILFLFLRDVKLTGNVSTKILLVLSLILCPFLHPASSLLLIIFVSLSLVYLKFVGISIFNKTKPIFFVLIFLVTYFSWLISITYRFGSELNYHIRWLLSLFTDSSSSPSQFNTLAQGLQTAGLPILDAFILYVKKFGPVHFLFFAAFLISLYVFYETVVKHQKNKKIYLVLSLLTVTYLFIYGFSMVFSSLLLGVRAYTYALLICLLLISAFIVDYLVPTKRKSKKLFLYGLCVLIACSLVFIATFNVYNSEFNKSVPSQCTYMNLNGMSWEITNRNCSLAIEEMGTQWQYHISNCLYGIRNKPSNLGRLVSVGHQHVFPVHFNYTSFDTLGSSFSEDFYFYLDKRVELGTTYVFPEYEYRWSFHPRDYCRLEEDSSLDKIYHNNEIKIFYLHGERKI